MSDQRSQTPAGPSGLNLRDIDQQQMFDDITALAAHLMATPIALVSLIEEDFQWFKAKVGLRCERKGLRGEQIPLCGRIVALADVYDALTTRRVYKEPMSHAKAREIIAGETGRHFDPDVVNAFLSVEYKFAVIGMEHAELARSAA